MNLKQIAAAIRSTVNLVDVLFFGGLFLVGYGASELLHGLGPLLVGLILIAYIHSAIDAVDSMKTELTANHGRSR